MRTKRETDLGALLRRFCALWYRSGATIAGHSASAIWGDYWGSGHGGSNAIHTCNPRIPGDSESQMLIFKYKRWYRESRIHVLRESTHSIDSALLEGYNQDITGSRSIESEILGIAEISRHRKLPYIGTQIEKHTTSSIRSEWFIE